VRAPLAHRVAGLRRVGWAGDDLDVDEASSADAALALHAERANWLELRVAARLAYFTAALPPGAEKLNEEAWGSVARCRVETGACARGVCVQ